MALATRRSRFCIALLVLAMLGCFLPATAQAADYTMYSQINGINWDSVTHGDPPLATSSPGTPFSIPYSAFSPGDWAVGVVLTFGCQTDFSQAKIVLDSGPDVYSFAPTAPSTRQLAMRYYDPLYLSASGSIPSAVMPQGWIDELSDGTLSGHLWVEGAPWAPQYGTLSAQTTFATPEPATLCLLAIGGLAMIRRRR